MHGVYLKTKNWVNKQSTLGSILIQLDNILSCFLDDSVVAGLHNSVSLLLMQIAQAISVLLTLIKWVIYLKCC